MADADLDPIFNAAGTEWNVDPNLLRAVAAQETGGSANPDRAVSRAGAVGRMQFMPQTAAQVGVTDPTDPQQAIYGSAKYLSQLMDKYKNPQLAVAAYNAGPDKIDQVLAGRAQLPNETAGYIPGVTQHYQRIAGAQKAATPMPVDPFTAALQASDPAPETTTQGGVSTMTVKPQAAVDDPFSQALAQPDQPASETAAKQAAVTQDQTDTGPTSYPTINNLLAGAKHGAKSVYDTGVRLAAAVDSQVPALNRLDANYGLDPQTAAAAQPAAEAAYQAKYGQSPAAGIGNMLGQAAATAPLIIAGGGALGAAGGALAESAGGAATLGGRALQAGTNLLTGTAAAPGAGFVGNALVRGGSLAAQGALTGAGAAALTGEDPGEGAKVGAIGGPLLGAAGGVIKGGVNVVKGAGNALASLAGRPSTKALDTAFEDIEAAAQARAAASGTSGGGASSGAAPTAPMPQPSGPSPGMGPSSAGAAATPGGGFTGPNAMTPAQAEASRATGFNYRMAQQASPGFDPLEYVKGSTPTFAEQMADPTAAAQQRVVSAGNEKFSTLDRANNEARVDHFDNLAGTPTTLETLEASRDAQAQQDLDAAWSNKQPANAAPVVQAAQSIIDGPQGKLSPVKNAMTDIVGALQKNDGSGLEDDPEMLYGVRKQISFLQSKAGKAQTPGYADATVQRALASIKDTLDQTIEPAAPGYQQYLSNYAAASRPIDTQSLLQSYRPTLLDASGNMQLSRVNTMMKAIGQKMNANGVNPAKSLDDNTVDQLFNLRSDLLRQNNRNLARPAGSNTQHDTQLASELGMNAVTGAAHLAGAHLPGANLLIGPAMARATASSNAKINAHLTNKLLTARPMQPLNPLSGITP